MIKKYSAGLLVLILLAMFSVSGGAQTMDAAALVDPAEVLSRARAVMGFANLGDSVVHTRWTTAVEQPYQSDRTYPPFFSMMVTGESWFSPRTGVERTTSEFAYPGTVSPPSSSVSDGQTRFVLRNNAAPVAVASDASRNLNAWLVVADWSKAQGVRFAGREMFRDYPRIVLTRNTDAGEQRLYLDPKTGFPVKLDYDESHYLWGQRHIQYIFSNWQQSVGIFTANSAFRMADDEVETSTTTGSAELLARESAPALDVPDAPKQALDQTPMFLRPLPPKTIDVSAATHILSNPGYNEAFTVIGDEVFVFDATQSEERARQDQEIIRKLFPNARRFTLVVTDLAWPHIAGMRYWVASGATVISHKAARPFLQQVLDRRWTRKPDLFERTRKTAKFHFVGVENSHDLVPGKLSVHAIDGIGSEVALMAYVAGDHFLWASDYVQSLSEPTMYANEVIAAVERAGVSPERMAAQHVGLTEWSKVVAAQHRAEKTAATP
jgi:hypothetical protein